MAWLTGDSSITKVANTIIHSFEKDESLLTTCCDDAYASKYSEDDALFSRLALQSGGIHIKHLEDRMMEGEPNRYGETEKKPVSRWKVTAFGAFCKMAIETNNKQLLNRMSSWQLRINQQFGIKK